MNADVHSAVGVATATGMALVLPAMHCNNLVDYGICLGVSVMGALIPDIDTNGDSKAKKAFRKVFAVAIGAMILSVLGVYRGTMSSQSIMDKLLSVQGIGMIGFLICCLIGYNTSHRCFTHQLIGLLAFTGTFYMFAGLQLTSWFGVGMLSHQVIDMLNKKKIYWLYPAKIDFARYVCYADSTMSKVIGGIATVLSVAFIGMYWLF